MKTVNLKSLIKIYNLNDGELPKLYMNFLGSKDYQLIVKQNELSPLESLIKVLSNQSYALNTSSFNSFFIGYEIPQIGKCYCIIGRTILL